MIDDENLRTSSLYINNQLLSRGLLRDGLAIEFADPAKAHGGTAVTMGHIISVVNDLILRRDVSTAIYPELPRERKKKKGRGKKKEIDENLEMNVHPLGD